MGMGMAPGSGSGIRGGLPEEKNVAQLVKENTNVYARRFQALLDRSTPHVMERWLVTAGLFLLFGLNVVLRQGVSGVDFLFNHVSMRLWLNLLGLLWIQDRQDERGRATSS